MLRSYSRTAAQVVFAIGIVKGILRSGTGPFRFDVASIKPTNPAEVGPVIQVLPSGGLKTVSTTL